MSKIGKDSLSTRSADYIDNVIDKNLDQNMNTITDETKESLVEAFMVTQSVNSDNAAQQIEDIRTEQLRTGDKITGMRLKSLNSLGLYGWINKDKYKGIYEVYNSLISDNSMSEKERRDALEWVDNALAARVILDSSVSSISHSFKKRALFEKKDMRDKVFDIIKDKYKEGKDFLIKTSESDLSSGHYFSIERIDEVGDIEKPEKPEPEDDEPEEESEAESEGETIETTPALDDELDVNFSDMIQTIKDISDERTYTKHSKEYVDAINKRKTKFGRMLVSAKHAMFGDMFRLNKYKKLRREINKDKTSLNLKGDWANVAHVHGQQDLRPVMELTESNYPTVYKAISDLSYRFYEGTSTMSESTFERELKKIFDSNDARGLKRRLKTKGVSIEKSASDILMSVKIQKAQNKLSYEVAQAVESALVGKILPLNAADQNALSSDIATKFKSFTNRHQLVPQLFAHYNKLAKSGEQVNLSDSYENIAKKMVSHLDSLTMIAAQSMTNKVKLNIKFLSKGHSTDHIEAKKGEKQKRWNPFSKLGGLMYGKGYRWRRFPVKLLATGGAAAAGTILLGPLAGIIGGSVLAGSLAAGKKAAQIQRKKQSVEKEYIKDRNNNANFSKEKNMKELKYLESIGNYEDIKTEFDRILSQPGLPDTEKENLIGLLSRVIAGLDHQKKTGHNAFSIDMGGKSEVDREKNYNQAMSDLHRYKELSLKRLQLEDVDIEEKDLREEDKYKSYRAGYKGDFKAFLKGFRKERRRATRKRGAKTGVTYAALGGLTRLTSEFLATLGGVAGSVDMVDIGSADTLYNLGEYNAVPQFSTDISTQLSSMPAGTTDIQVDYFAGVDGTPASSAVLNSTTVDAQITDIQNELRAGIFSFETSQSVAEQIDLVNIRKLIAYAQTNGADVGNQHLFVARNLEGIHDVLKEIEGKPKLKLDFNFDSTDSIIGSTSYIPKDRMTGVDLFKVDDIAAISAPDRGQDLRAGQGLYTEDNTHKGQK